MFVNTILDAISDFYTAAIDLMLDRGYSHDYGARPMKRVFERDLQNRLATDLLSGKYPPNTEVKVDVSQGEFTLVGQPR